MKNNFRDCWRKWRWILLIAVASLFVSIAMYSVEWTAVFCWWSGDTAPHESLRNFGLIIAAFVGVGLATWRSIVAASQAKTTQQGHITDRYSKAVEQLGSEKVSVRIGGIYALKRIAQDSMERDHISVMDVLTNFIRYSPYADEQRASSEQADAREDFRERVRNDPTFAHANDEPPHPRFIDCPDIIAAIDTIQTRSEEQRKFEASQNYNPSLKYADFSYLLLNDVNLSGFQLDGVNLKYANVVGINLSNVDLSGTDLVRVDLSTANLGGIDLTDSDLSHANLHGANLRDAILHRTILSSADLRHADLTGADLTNAQLGYAKLIHSDLSNANLTNADLTGADLSETNLSNANLSGTQLQGTNDMRFRLSFDEFVGLNPQYANMSREQFHQLLEAPDLSKAFTRKGELPINLPEGVTPPPELED